jgi:hypothetical protein
LLTKSASVANFYIHQFWHTIKLDLSEEFFTCTLHKRQVTVDIDSLCSVLALPELGPDEQYHPVPDEDELITFLRDIQ